MSFHIIEYLIKKFVLSSQAAKDLFGNFGRHYLRLPTPARRMFFTEELPASSGKKWRPDARDWIIRGRSSSRSRRTPYWIIRGQGAARHPGLDHPG